MGGDAGAELSTAHRPGVQHAVPPGTGDTWVPGLAEGWGRGPGEAGALQGAGVVPDAGVFRIKRSSSPAARAVRMCRPRQPLCFWNMAVNSDGPIYSSLRAGDAEQMLWV